MCLGELQCCSLKDNNLQDSSLLPSVCWQRGEAVYRQNKSLLEARKVQLESVFPIILQKITKQHHNYSHAWLSQHGAARRAGRREWCCGLALVTLGNVTGTLRPWALSPESLPQPACVAQPHNAAAPGGSQAATPQQRMCQQLGSCSWLSWTCQKGLCVPEPHSQWHCPAHCSTAQGVDGVRCNRHREISCTLGEEKPMDSPSELPSGQAGSNPAFMGFFLQSIE